MKGLFVVCVSFLLSHGMAIAAPTGLPSNVCSGTFCGPAQKQIWDRFQDATGLDIRLIPSVYSGSCYHNSALLDPHKRHFGGLLLDKVNGQVSFDGKFSFFEKKQPYAHLNVETARVRFAAHWDVILYDEFAYAEAIDPREPSRYWFRQEQRDDGLLLVGYFGYQHTILCALDRHPN